MTGAGRLQCCHWSTL